MHCDSVDIDLGRDRIKRGVELRYRYRQVAFDRALKDQMPLWEGSLLVTDETPDLSLPGLDLG